ncbi:MAG: hypothetical protein N2506_05410 [Dehalococcoidales bacterium]|nr:hypothetical protein [Dehalococcoidales bacterium]
MDGHNSVSDTVMIEADGMHFRDLNARIRAAAAAGARKIILSSVCGQRYLGTGISRDMEIEIHGTPGNDLGAFMNGPKITVFGNAQDGCGNTMNRGAIIIHGHAGDVLGLAARGGKILVQGGVGYRAGIHMKEYQEKKPVVVIGGTAQDFLGEYMAGGIIILLGLTLNGGEAHRARFIGTGMHGGVIYVRGKVGEFQVGREVGMASPGEEDLAIIKRHVEEFAACFGYDAQKILAHDFVKLFPRYLRPYGRLYAY